jgi:hypothetical protein
VYEGEPHGLFYTSRERLNVDLLHFIKGEQLVEEAAVPGSFVFPTTPEL